MTVPFVAGLSGWHEHRPAAALAALLRGPQAAQVTPDWRLYVGLAHEQAGSHAEAIAVIS
jgi:hypothetical protein